MIQETITGIIISRLVLSQMARLGKDLHAYAKILAHVQMFHDFVQLIGDEQKIVAEREAILDRAKLMNDIVNF